MFLKNESLWSGVLLLWLVFVFADVIVTIESRNTVQTVVVDFSFVFKVSLNILDTEKLWFLKIAPFVIKSNSVISNI